MTAELTIRDPAATVVRDVTAWLRLVAVGPYALLAALTAYTVAQRRAEPGPLTVDLALCAATALWMLALVTVRPGWRERPVLMTVFLVGLAAITLVLVVRDPWFGVFTPAGYVYAFRLLRWPWRLGGICAFAVVAGTAQASGIPRTTVAGVLTWAAVVVVNVVPMCALAWALERDRLRQEERLRALDEARAANERLAAALAENAALQERLVGQARAAGIRDERERLAREIHDTLAQGLTGIVAQLRAAEAAGDDLAAEDPADRAGWRRHVTLAAQLSRESLAEARRSVHALRPQELECAALGAAIADIAGRWSARHGLAVQVTTTGAPGPLRPEAEAALLRAAQEALANVAKHAEASRVGVTLSYLDDEVALDVRDDGRGFDPGATGGPHAGGGFGLVAMRQRIEALDGTLQIESRPRHGTGISARVPLGAGA
ncbi:sensor histidine kinase [Pseudofrankia inefficax]|uniref:Oxygen sensor histidine kinase NreB n=1 Tax=Pseudofrankia inefficax (strain DSM 45817 / CECT 9037 / DDB 130130 / EuI1c) TaxID=298654 RepID=E3J844_PSEI1|nr:sensor histidine kinase [Pseudofrankia inefficax]ADP83237.1 integral membrane sensor signal transduction histidine kinase [Pseudofrankia inefficax]